MECISLPAFIATTGIVFAALLKWSIPTKQYRSFLKDISSALQMSMHNICLGAVVSNGAILLPIFAVTILYCMQVGQALTIRQISCGLPCHDMDLFKTSYVAFLDMCPSST
jgi:hypothetical protein